MRTPDLTMGQNVLKWDFPIKTWHVYYNLYSTEYHLISEWIKWIKIMFNSNFSRAYQLHKVRSYLCSNVTHSGWTCLSDTECISWSVSSLFFLILFLPGRIWGWVSILKPWERKYALPPSFPCLEKGLHYTLTLCLITEITQP